MALGHRGGGHRGGHGHHHGGGRWIGRGMGPIYGGGYPYYDSGCPWGTYPHWRSDPRGTPYLACVPAPMPMLGTTATVSFDRVISFQNRVKALQRQCPVAAIHHDLIELANAPESQIRTILGSKQSDFMTSEFLGMETALSALERQCGSVASSVVSRPSNGIPLAPLLLIGGAVALGGLYLWSRKS